MIFHFDPDEKGLQKVMAIAQSLGPAKYGYIGEFKKNHPVRSNKANRWYWVAIVKTICIYTGEPDKDRIHNLLQLMCNYNERKLKDGRVIREAKGTHDMNEQEFAAYCTRAKDAAQREFDGIIFVEEGRYNTYVEQAIEEQFKSVFNR